MVAKVGKTRPWSRQLSWMEFTTLLAELNSDNQWTKSSSSSALTRRSPKSPSFCLASAQIITSRTDSKRWENKICKY
jgi:hypothetical protein